MKDLEELHFPADRMYTEDDFWAREDDGPVRVGISDYLQDCLGAISLVELPDVGSELNSGEECGTIEGENYSVDICMPVGGRIVAVNEELDDDPCLLNEDPYGAWIMAIEPNESYELENLMSSDEYYTLLDE